MPPTTPDRPGVIALPPLIYAIALALGLSLHWLWPVGFLPRAWRSALGWALVAVSLLIAAAAFRALARAKTSFKTYEPTTAVVRDGPFRFSRNPIYLSLTVLYLGVIVLIKTLWGFVLVAPLFGVVQHGVIKPEERSLEQKFGEEYLRYKARVRRWI